MDKVLLIDAHNAMHRANIGFNKPFPKAVPKKGEDDEWNMRGTETPEQTAEEIAAAQAALEETERHLVKFNFFRNLRPLIEQFSPDKCFFVLEGHPQFRYDLFAEYKANRIIKTAEKQEAMDKFFQSKDEIVRLMQYLPITTVRAANYECDDVIATLCENMKDEDVTILSSDSDFIQLLQKGYQNCKVYSPIKKEFMTAPVYPYVAWKSLVGDTSDNIPGFPGIGPKKAEAMLSDPKKFQKFMDIEENRANFQVYRELIEFRFIPEEEIVFKDGIKNFDELKVEFEKMKFDSITNEKSWNKYVKTFDCLKY
jgi:DNA polymerase-1